MQQVRDDITEKRKLITLGKCMKEMVVRQHFPHYVDHIPAARFHVTAGLGKPSALHSILASLP